MRHGVALAAGVVLGALFTSEPARAIERQHHLGLGPQLSILAIADKSTASVGAGVSLHYAYGLSDTWNLMVEGSWARVAASQKEDPPEAPKTRPEGADHAAAGIGYVLDVFKWVPYLSLLAGAYRLSDGTLTSDLWLPGVSAGLGLDYQLSRSFAIGVGAREHLMVTKLGTYPSYTTVMLRAEYMWGW